MLTSAGAIESRVSVRTVHVTADGRKLGVTLKVGVMTDLAEGDVRHLTLRVTTPSGSYPRSALRVLGHDELDIVAGTLPLSHSQVFYGSASRPAPRCDSLTRAHPSR